MRFITTWDKLTVSMYDEDFPSLAAVGARAARRCLEELLSVVGDEPFPICRRADLVVAESSSGRRRGETGLCPMIQHGQVGRLN